MKTIDNQVFLDQNFESHDQFHNEFDNEFNNKYNNKFNDKFDDKSFASSKAFGQNKQNLVKVDLITTYCTIYARKNLVKILNRKVVMPKQ